MLMLEMKVPTHYTLYSNPILNATYLNAFFFLYTCSATLLAFLVDLLKSSVAMQEQMLGGKGFLVIGYLLEKVR